MKRKAFNIGMCVAWALLTIAYAILGALGVQVTGWEVFWPCLMVSFTYFERIFEKT